MKNALEFMQKFFAAKPSKALAASDILSDTAPKRSENSGELRQTVAKAGGTASA
jgi:hypothetical protein